MAFQPNVSVVVLLLLQYYVSCCFSNYLLDVAFFPFDPHVSLDHLFIFQLLSHAVAAICTVLLQLTFSWCFGADVFGPVRSEAGWILTRVGVWRHP
jgi:hypothetical protein